MSGVYIKGLEMPKSCFKCGFYHHSVDDGYYDFEYCGANNAEFNNAYDSTKPHINPFVEKLRTCPLVPVPTHGRLIDADALSAKLNMMLTMAFSEGNTAFHFAYRSLGKVVENAPTIIPAEEGE